MTKLHHVKSARKDYPNTNIKKGDSYYWWQFSFSPPRRSKIRPSRSQLTRDDFYSQIWDIEDSRIVEISCSDDIQSIIDELKILRDKQEEKRNNIPDSLQENNTGTMLQGRYDSIEEMIDEFDHFLDDITTAESKVENKETEINDCEVLSDDILAIMEKELSVLQADLEASVEAAKNVSYTDE